MAGQITAYATLILSAQYRTHIFLILIFKAYYRLIHWDQGRAVVTALISHVDNSYLLDFLICFGNADPQACSHDITAGVPNKDEESKARELKELKGIASLISLSIPDSSSPHKLSRYIVAAPCSRPDVPVGRWTRVSIAYDVNRGKRVLLKDSWRVLLPDILPEGDIYRILHDHLVPNIPHCPLAADIGEDRYHSSRTHEFNNKYGSPHPLAHLVPHRHYRLVLDTIGRPLESFKRSCEFVTAIRDAIVGKFAICYLLGNVT